MVSLQIIGGLMLLLVGGEILVRGAVAVANRLGISPMVIGLTLVGCGTSAPELVASVNAALAGAPGLAVGNVVGSNIANVLLILGTSAVVYPIYTNREAFRRDGPFLLFSAVLFVVIAYYGHLGRWLAALLLALLAGYMVLSYWLDRRQSDAPAELHAAEAKERMAEGMGTGAGLFLAIAGIGSVVWGADLLVDGSVTLARAAGLSETVIGLTLVAVGTSLPELITSVMAAIRKHGDVAFGNIVGSNLFNTFGILGVTAMVRPISVPPEILTLDVWVMLAATVALLIFAQTGLRLARWEACVFLGGYLVYVGTKLAVILMDRPERVL